MDHHGIRSHCFSDDWVRIFGIIDDRIWSQPPGASSLATFKDFASFVSRRYWMFFFYKKKITFVFDVEASQSTEASQRGIPSKVITQSNEVCKRKCVKVQVCRQGKSTGNIVSLPQSNDSIFFPNVGFLTGNQTK